METKRRHSNTGCIALYDRDGDIIQLRIYNSLQRRRDILESWRKLYGPRFSELSYGITPDIDPSKLKKINLNEYGQKMAA